ncbi:hypothetical protein HK097_007777 [Rhizophlyctis rosea]|uniref:Polysaccharide lyase 14 domain-containing protein n=1 Tax=Rhizophlyctis rosea TaxID=64517 RepID=A0AAD5SCP6_9FUNG|nr:hypothetical protein HK097_007777 [Rhizophlyctis rosea]
MLALSITPQSVSAAAACKDLGCGAGCPHACPFGFPCSTAADCLSGSCSGGYCDIGSPTKLGAVNKPAAPAAQPTTTGTSGSGTWGLPDFSAGSLAPLKIKKDSYGQNNRAIVSDPAGTGKKVLRIFYPARSYNPSGSPRGGTGFYGVPVDISKAKEATFQFQIYFPAGFNFVKGGKLPGLYGGREGCSGGDPAKDCFSTRFMFRKSGSAEIYLYVQDKKQDPGFCKVPPLSVCNGVYGNSIGRGAFTYTPGKWQTLMQRIVLNDPGKTNGRVQVWSNGKLVIDFNKVMWRDKPFGFVGIDFETFFGGSDRSWATPTDQYVYFKGMSLSWA